MDLSPWLAGRGAGGPGRPLYAETVTPTRYYGASSLLGVIVDGWKYIETTRPELYDLRQRSRGETVNLLEREPARADALGKELEAILTAAGRAPRPAPESAALDEDVPPAPGGARIPGPGRRRPRAGGFDRSKEDPKDLIALLSQGPAAQRSWWTTRSTPRPGPSARRCSGSGRDSPTAICRCPRSPRPTATSTRP